MQHNAYINFFKGRAMSHYLMRHNAADADLPSGRRVSFFRMNNEMEMQQALGAQADFPCLLLPEYRGRLRDNGGLVSDVMTGLFEIRVHVDDPLDFEQIEAARDTCKQIGMEIIAWMLQTIEDAGECGPFSDIDANSVQYDFTGPINQAEYGCLFLFEFSDTAFNVITADLSGVFIMSQPPI